MNKYLAMAVVIALITVAIGIDCAAADEVKGLLAGAAKADITYHPGITRGNAPQPIRAEDIKDRLFARVVVLRDGETSLAIVSADAIFFASEELVRTAREKWDLDHVILTGTHTHSGGYPDGGGTTVHPEGTRNAQWTRMGDPADVLNWEFPEDEWYKETKVKVLAAIGEASANAFPARIAVGSAPLQSAYFAHNRRLVGADGKVRMLWDNPDRIPTEPLDPTVRVIRIDDENGRARILLVHYACHAVTMMGSGVVSADFPGAMCSYVEQEMGEDCTAMFLQGAEGDIDPYLMRLPATKHRDNVIFQMGKSLGGHAMSIAQELEPSSQAPGSLKVQESLLTFEHRKVGAYTPKPGSTSKVGLTTVVYDDKFALLAIPGEPFIQHQLDLAAKSPIPESLILGLAYSGQGTPFAIYIPTEEAIRQGGYGADEATFLAAGAGESMVDEGVKCIQRMLPAQGETK